VEGGSISAIGRDLVPAAEPGVEVIDAAGMLVIPGFVNAHYHSHDVLAKGLMEDLTLEQWFTLSGTLGVRRALAEVRARTLAGAVECLRNGITTVQDLSSFWPLGEEVLDAILGAYAEAGIRVVYSVSLRDLPPIDALPWMRELAPAELHDLIGTRATRPARRSTSLRARLTESASARACCAGRSVPPRRSAARTRCSRRWPIGRGGGAFRCTRTCMKRGYSVSSSSSARRTAARPSAYWNRLACSVRLSPSLTASGLMRTNST